SARRFAVSMRTGARSIPVTSAPCAAARSATAPVPQPRSSHLLPGPGCRRSVTVSWRSEIVSAIFSNGPLPHITPCLDFSSSNATSCPPWPPRGAAYFGGGERFVLRRGQRTAAQNRAARASDAPTAARGLRRTGADPRRAGGAPAPERRGPGRLADPLRAAREREDNARARDREHDRRVLRGALCRVGDRVPGARGDRRRARTARGARAADDPLPRRDPPLQQGAAGR